MAQPNGEAFEIMRGVTTLDISDLINYHVVEFDGFGAPPIRRLTQRGPLQNGDSDVGFRLDARTMRVSVLARASTPAAMHTDREQLMGMLAPDPIANAPVRLRWTFQGEQRQIDCHLQDGLSLPSSQMIAQNFRDVIVLRASDPTWYDPAGSSILFAQTGGGSPWAVPVVFPTNFGASNLSGSAMVNLSDANVWDTFPIIYATGPVTGLVLINTATGDKLDFTGSSIGGGVTYTIDLRYGYKTVIDSSSVNRINQLTSDSNIATWRLVKGINTITATGTSILAATNIYIQYNTRFIGV